MSSHKVTRRAIASAIAAVPIVAATTSHLSAAVAGDEQSAKQVPAAPPALGLDPVKKAQDEIRKTSEKLRAIEVPMSVEPAFTFRA